MVGEALAYVQGFGLKAIAVVLVRLTNSPAARGNSGSRFRQDREWPRGGLQLLAGFLRHLPVAFRLDEIRLADRAACLRSGAGGTGSAFPYCWRAK